MSSKIFIAGRVQSFPHKRRSGVTVWAIPHVIAFLRYIRKLIKLRRDNPESDLTSALIQAEEGGDKLDEDELLAMIFLLLVAGQETTVNLIGNSALALLRNPHQIEMLRHNPSLIESAVEELLRFDGPLETATERYALEDVLISGSTIPRGALVYVVLLPPTVMNDSSRTQTRWISLARTIGIWLLAKEYIIASVLLWLGLKLKSQ